MIEIGKDRIEDLFELTSGNSKEFSVDIGPCDNSISYPCGISKLKVLKDKLLIIFDSPEENPRKREINISDILD